MNQALFTPAMENKVKNIEKDIKGMKSAIINLQKAFGSCMTSSDLNLSESRTRQLVNENNTSISTLEQKLTMINLPEDTRYYLEQSEVESFRGNFQKMMSMMSDMEKMYDALVAYSATLK